MSLAAHRAGHCVGLSVLPLSACRWPGLAPAGDLLLCVAKEEGKKGDPAKPVVGVADDSPALLAPGGRGGTRRRCRLRQQPRKAPPVTALLGGSDGLSTRRVPLLKQRSNSNPSITPVRSVVARCIRIARSEPPSSGVLGGEVRGGCLSRHRRRVQPRPPVASSAGESAAGRPVKPGRLLCLLSWRSKKVGRPPGRDPANVTSFKVHARTPPGKTPPSTAPDPSPSPPAGQSTPATTPAAQSRRSSPHGPPPDPTRQKPPRAWPPPTAAGKTPGWA